MGHHNRNRQLLQLLRAVLCLRGGHLARAVLEYRLLVVLGVVVAVQVARHRLLVRLPRPRHPRLQPHLRHKRLRQRNRLLPLLSLDQRLPQLPHSHAELGGQLM